MKIIFSKHAKYKIAERNIAISLIKRILRHPELIYYDLSSKTLIAIGGVELIHGRRVQDG